MPLHDYACSLEGQELDLSITVEDFETGEVAVDSVRVVARMDPETMGCPP